MKEFIISLFESENFTLYLGIIIGILILAFFVVFFIGKKDQKNIEKTQRLEKINMDAFANSAVPVEVSPSPDASINQTLSMDNQKVNTISDVTQSVQNSNPQVMEQPQVQAPVMPEVVEQAIPSPDTVAFEQPVLEQPVVEMQTPIAPVVTAPAESASPNETNPDDISFEESTLDVPSPDTVYFEQLVVETQTSTPVDTSIPVEQISVETDFPAPIIEPIIQETMQPEVPVVPVMTSDVSFEQPVIEENINNNEILEVPTINEENIHDEFNNLANSISNELEAMEKAKNQYQELSNTPVETPIVEVKVDDKPFVMPEAESKPIFEEVKEEAINPVVEQKREEPPKPFTPSTVFSSVYAPVNNTPVSNNYGYSDEEEMDIELPRLK